MKELELREYPFGVIKQILGTSNKQNTDQKLERYGYGFTSSGWGTSRVYTITALPDALSILKTYCVFSLGVSPQTDFRKFRDFIFYLLADDDFNWRPDEMMEEYLRLEGCGMTRQTIAKYKANLTKLGFFSPHGDFVYYKVFKKYGVQEHEVITEEEYRKAWRLYWEFRNAHPDSDSRPAYSHMYTLFGGVPRKQQRIEENAFYKQEINHLFALVSNSILEEVSD